MIISPTVGRIVWYTPGSYDAIMRHDQGPLAAMVAHVWGDRMVNLMVSDSNGNPHSRTSIQLMQEGDVRPSGNSFCEWMPYQVGQAKKHAA